MNLRLRSIAYRALAITAIQGGDAARATYLGAYAGGYRGRGRSARPLWQRAPEDRAFVEQVGELVGSRVTVYDSRVLGSEGDSVVLLHDGLRVAIPVTDVEFAAGRVRYALPALRPGHSPGFVHRAGGLDQETPITRIYVNVRPPDAWVILGPVFEALEAAGIECDAKVLAHPSNYFRADSAVIYIPSEAELRALRILQRVLDDHTVRLDKHTPALAKRIARGIAVADEPSDLAAAGEMSHGQWVTGILVEAVEGTDDVEETAARIEQLIIRDGRDPQRPYRRGAGSITHPIG